MTTSTKADVAKKSETQGKPLSEIAGAAEALTTSATVTGMTYKLETPSDAPLDAAFFLAAGETATVQTGRAFAVFDGGKDGATPIPFLALEAVKISGPAIWCPVDSDETLESLAPRLVTKKVDTGNLALAVGIFVALFSGGCGMVGFMLHALGTPIEFVVVVLWILVSFGVVFVADQAEKSGASEIRGKVETLVAKTRSIKTPEKIAALAGSRA